MKSLTNPGGEITLAPVEDDGGRNDSDASQDGHDRQDHGVSTQTSRPVYVPLLQAVPGHDREGEGHDVDGPEGAEAGEDGQDEVVSRLGGVHSCLRAGAGFTTQRGTRRTTSQRARPAAGLCGDGRAHNGHHPVTVLHGIGVNGQVIHLFVILRDGGRGL